MHIPSRVRDIATLAAHRDLGQAGEQAIDLILEVGLDGSDRIDGASEVAWAAMERRPGDVEAAVAHVVATHTRTVSATGFVTGLGGIATLPAAVPTDVVVLYAQAARMAGAVAQLRGYDLGTDDVRSAVAISLVGEMGSDKLRRIDSGLASIADLDALGRLPRQVLKAVNRRIGVRLVARLGTKSVLGLGRNLPVISGGVWAGLDAVSLRRIAWAARANFPALTAEGSDEEQVA